MTQEELNRKTIKIINSITEITFHISYNKDVYSFVIHNMLMKFPKPLLQTTFISVSWDVALCSMLAVCIHYP
jgi:hypothetical protein